MKSKKEEFAQPEIPMAMRDKGQKARPYVFVTPDGPEDGGDFGRLTPGTKTSGLQEALDYAHEKFRAVYIWAGRGGMHGGVGTFENVYTLDETLKVPWAQDFRLDGGHAVLSFTKKTGNAVAIDSQMNCKYTFGLVVSSSSDAAVVIKPVTPGPDDFVVVTASEFEFAAPVSGHPDGTGVLLDSTEGPIINSKVFCQEVNSQGTAVHLSDGGGSGKWISNNIVQVMYGNQYHGVGDSIGLKVGEQGSDKIVDNRIEMSLHAPAGAYFDEKSRSYKMPKDFTPPEGAIGADIYAQSNVYTLAFYGKRAPGRDIVFEPDSNENTVFALNMPNGYTNKSRVPTNVIVPNWPVGFDVLTPPVPRSGKAAVNSNPFSIAALILSAGLVSSWKIIDAEKTTRLYPRNLTIVGSHSERNRRGRAEEPKSQTVKSGFFSGQMILLDPGDKIELKYAQAPKWRWKAVR